MKRQNAEAIRKALIDVARALDKLKHMAEPTAESAVEMVGSIGISTWDPKDQITKSLDKLEHGCYEIRHEIYKRLKATAAAEV